MKVFDAGPHWKLVPGGSCPEGRPVAVESRHVTRVPWLRLCRARLHCHRLQSPQRHWEQERRIGSHPPQFDKSAWLKATILDSICWHLACGQLRVKTGVFRGEDAHNSGTCRPCVFHLRISVAQNLCHAYVCLNTWCLCCSQSTHTGGICRDTTETCFYCHMDGHQRTSDLRGLKYSESTHAHRCSTLSHQPIIMSL